jgi:hypothetical protein
LAFVDACTHKPSLLDGREHSYWDLDEARLRDDITNR